MRTITKSIVLALMLITGIANAQWSYQGGIYGDNQDDELGTSVDLNADGSIIVVGAPYNDNNNRDDNGHVKVYNLTTMSQIGNDIEGGMSESNFGHAVAINNTGNIIVVGANRDGGGSFTRGSASVYINNSGTWTALGSQIDGEIDGDELGTSVSINGAGNIIAIGAEDKDTDGSGGDSYHGQVTIYEYNTGTTSWDLIGTLNGVNGSDHFGHSVSLNNEGDILAVGAHTYNGGSSGAGYTKIFRNNAGTWELIGSQIDGEVVGDESGNSVSLNANGDIVVIGEHKNEDTGSNSGQVRVFKNISNSWTQIGADINGWTVNDNYGRKVSINDAGDKIAISGEVTSGTSFLGHTEIYYNNAGTWIQIGADIRGSIAYDYLGSAISFSASGNTIAIGANYGTDNNRGYVVTYNGNSDSTLTVSACDTYTSPSGKNWTTSGTYYDTIPNALHCDSLLTINLTINNSTTSTDVQTACGSYTWIDNITYYSDNNSATHTLTNAVGCDSVVTLDLTINPNPVAPTSVTATNTTICSGENTTLSYTGGSGNIFKWYTASCGGSFVADGNNISVSPTSTTTYYGRWENSCGNSSCETVTITVSADVIAPTLVTATSTAICSGESTILSYNGGSGDTFKWYTASCGGTFVGNGNNLSVSPTVETTYYGRWENSCDVSTCETVTITINPDAIAPTSVSASATDITEGESTTLSYTGGSGDTFKWYKGSCGGSFVGIDNNLSVTPTVTTTYYGLWENSCGTSSCESITINVTTSGCTYCSTTSSTDDATGVTYVGFNTIDNSSSGSPEYTDNTTESTDIAVNNSYNLSVRVNTAGGFTVYAKAWIDWNKDCDFDDAGEEYDLGTAYDVVDGATSLSPLSITVPSGATLGTTTMRIRAKYSSEALACGDQSYSEAEDYTVNIVNGSAPTPVATVLATASCGTGSVTVSSDLSGTQTFYLRNNSGGAISDWTGNATSHEFTGLSNNTYKGQVEKDGNMSTLSSAVTLTNLANPISANSVSATDNAICSGESTILSYNGGSGDTFKWYTASCGGTFVGDGNNLSVSPTSATTYYGRWENSCGNSSCESVTITINPDAVAPTSVTASVTDITEGESTTLSYSAGNGDTFVWYSGSCGGTFEGNGNNLSVSPTVTTTYYGLWENTCGNSTCESVTINVSTGCSAMTVPYTQDFEGSAFLPDCWSKNIADASNDITLEDAMNHTSGGQNSLRFSSLQNSSDYNQYLFSPSFDIPSNCKLKFWHRKFNDDAEDLQWGISTTTNPVDYTWTSVTLSETDWQETIVDLSAYAGQTIYVGFHYYGEYLYYVYLDDFQLYNTVTDVKNISETQVNIYPNPTNGIVNIEGENINKIEVYNISGKKIIETININNLTSIDISDHQNGIYFIHITSDNGVLVKKIVLQ